MSLTNTNREARRPERSVGLRDLRFAGTVAAGLVAGVLGVGALSAPLLGWTDWPDSLQPGANNQTVQMPPAQQRQTVAHPPNSGSRTPSGPTAVPGVGATALVALPGVTGGTTPVGGGGSTPAIIRSVDRTGTSSQGTGSGDFGGDGFIA